MEATGRCDWGDRGGELLRRYHDTEWGVPVHDDGKQFEYLVLEGAQAGLSWLTVLRKREAYRSAFAGFDPVEVARFGEKEIEALLGNPGIIRNRLKIASTVTNARAFLEIQEEFGSFNAYIWGFVDGEPIREPLEHDVRPSCHLSPIGHIKQGPEKPGLQVRGQHHRLRAHAGGRPGERSPGELLSIRGMCRDVSLRDGSMGSGVHSTCMPVSRIRAGTTPTETHANVPALEPVGIAHES